MLYAGEMWEGPLGGWGPAMLTGRGCSEHLGTVGSRSTAGHLQLPMSRLEPNLLHLYPLRSLGVGTTGTTSPTLRAPGRVGSAVDEFLKLLDMDTQRSQTPKGPKGKPDGTSLVAGTAKANPTAKKPSRAKHNTTPQESSTTGTVGLPPFTSGGKAAKSTLTSASTHTHGGGAATVAPPHTKRSPVVGRGETGKPEEPRLSSWTAHSAGPVPTLKEGATLDAARATGQPATRTAEEAALRRFDEAWTLVDRRRAKGNRGKSEGSARVTGMPQSGGKPKPKRKSKKQRQQKKKRALAEAAKRDSATQAGEPQAEGSIKHAKGAAGGQGNRAAGRNQRGKMQARGGAKGAGTSAAGAKRNLDDSQSPRKPIPKRLRLVDGAYVPYADAVRSDLLVAVITMTGDPLTAQAAEEVQALLQGRLVKDVTGGADDEPKFQGKPTYADGALKLWCENHDTVEYLKRVVSELTLSTGARLMVKRQCDLARLVRCGVLLPGNQLDTWQMGRALRQQNKWAKVDSWILHKVDKQEDNTFLIFSAPEDVVQALIERGRRLCYLLGSVYVKFQGQRGKFTEHLPTEQDDPMEVASGGEQAEGEGSGAISTIPEPPPMRQRSPKPQAEVAEDGEELLREPGEEACIASLDNLAMGGTATEEEMEGLSDDGLPSSPLL